MKLPDFMREFGDKETIVEKLRNLNLLRRNIFCSSCGGPMFERRRETTSDGSIFRCDKRSCEKAKSIRYGSFFERSRLSLCDCMLLMHLWSKGYTEKLIRDDFHLSKVTIVDWFRYCRELCVQQFESNTNIIGGPGCIVELDETFIVKRKYNRGRILRAGWLFGGVERRDDGQFRCFIRMVYDRSAPHLTYLIRQHVVPGTHIITDGWGAYRELSNMGYTHSVVIHQENFVSPTDRSIHTQRIEATWGSIKRFIRSRGTNKGPHCLEYICEYLFRRKHENVFEALLDIIKEEYPPND